MKRKTQFFSHSSQIPVPERSVSLVATVLASKGCSHFLNKPSLYISVISKHPQPSNFGFVRGRL